MDCELPCITMPPVRILCITVHYLTYSALSSALLCITVHSRGVAVQYCGIRPCPFIINGKWEIKISDTGSTLRECHGFLPVPLRIWMVTPRVTLIDEDMPYLME